MVADEDYGGVFVEQLLLYPVDKVKGLTRGAVNRCEIVVLDAAVAVLAAVTAFKCVGVHCVHCDKERFVLLGDVGDELLGYIEQLSVLDAPFPHIIGAFVGVALV